MGGFDHADVLSAVARVADALDAQRERFTKLDQAVGDGDLGVTIGKVAAAVRAQAREDVSDDIGRALVGLGMAINRAASSTMGTLVATGLLRAGKKVMGKTEVLPKDLALMLQAADEGIQERGKAEPGDKTIVDALRPSARAFSATLVDQGGLSLAVERALAAARDGRDRVTPLQSRIGRSSWLGERSKGAVDPGCEVWITILEALAGSRS